MPRDRKVVRFTQLFRRGSVMPDARRTLEELLYALGESSQFVTSGGIAPVLPGLEVKGVGPIGFPVTPADAQRLIAKATQAPYGRGEGDHRRYRRPPRLANRTVTVHTPQ